MCTESPLKTSQDGGYISLNHLKPLLDYLDAQHLPLATVLEAMGITAEQRYQDDIVIDGAHEDAAFVAARALTGDNNVGLRAGVCMTPPHLGMLGHLLMTCSSMADLMTFHTRYGAVVGNGLRPEYVVGTNGLVLVLRRREGAERQRPRLVLEYSLAGWLTIARWLVGEDFAPTLVELPFKSPPDAEFNSVFRCPVLFGQPLIKIHFGLELLEQPFRHTYAGARDMLEEKVAQRLPSSPPNQDSWLNRVTHQIELALPDATLSVHTLAATLGTASRTLQRELKHRHTSYIQLLDEARKTQAQRMVKSTDLPFSDISLALGFSDQTVFQRAFKRWFGTTPGELRRSMRSPLH